MGRAANTAQMLFSYLEQYPIIFYKKTSRDLVLSLRPAL